MNVNHLNLNKTEDLFNQFLILIIEVGWNRTNSDQVNRFTVYRHPIRQLLR